MENINLSAAMDDLHLLAKCSDALIGLASRIRALSGVRSVVRGVDVRTYTGFDAYEGFIEVETRSDRKLTWWTELHRYPDRWTGEAVVLEMVNDEQKRVKVLSSFETANRAELESHWDTLVGSLKNSIEPQLLQ